MWYTVKQCFTVYHLTRNNSVTLFSISSVVYICFNSYFPVLTMVRSRDKPRKIGNSGEKEMTEAVNLVLNENYSLREAAKAKGVPYVTLFRYVKKKKNNPESNIKMEPNYDVRKVFSKEQEQDLANYIQKCSKMCYGLSTTGLRRLGYEMAEKNNIDMPPSWKTGKCAGLEWLRGFLHRNNQLSIRKPESCSLSRLTSFNKHNVEMFFNNLTSVYAQVPDLADGCRVFNLDETGVTTVQKPKKVVGMKGVKQLNQCTSAERGELVTAVFIVSAAGTFLPPAMVFPRKNFKIHMINGAPNGTLGLASSSGWMTSELFPRVMEHFIKHTNSSKENPSLLITDNHESHMCIEVLDLAKNAGVTMLTLPPHCSHKMQPLDLSVFGPFKSYYNTSVDSWLLRNPGRTMTIYQIAECVGESFLRACTPSNITAGFRRSGIHPLDIDIFDESDFIMSEVSNRPDETRSVRLMKLNKLLKDHPMKHKEAMKRELHLSVTFHQNSFEAILKLHLAKQVDV